MSSFPAPTIIRSRRKSLSLSIAAGPKLVVKAPLFITNGAIMRFLEEHREWIEKKLRVLEQVAPDGKKHYTDGEEFLYLGTPHRLTIGDYQVIRAHNGILEYPKFLKFRIQKELEVWYIKQARHIITQQVKFYAEQMDVSYSSINFSDTRSQWGSCSHDDRLQFSWRLVMTPLLVINYVVIHELAHTKEKNHSSDFWNVVRNYTPSYRQQIKWLKTYGHALHI
jgi:predicted metal-dependent hydrolase